MREEEGQGQKGELRSKVLKTKDEGGRKFET